jgi:hypothetical protein
MALKKTVTTAHGFEAKDAYHRVEAVSILNKTQLRFKLRSYIDPEKEFFGEQDMEVAYDLDGTNPIKQAYVQLKQLSDFAGATDC